MHRGIRTLYCQKCGAEVYSNERKCWNCGAKTTNRKVRCIVLTILCIFFFIGCICVSDYGYNKGLEDGKIEGVQDGINETTKKYESEIVELNSNHKVELKEAKDTYYKKGKKDDVEKYKKKLKKGKEEKKKQEEEQQYQEEQEEQASSESEEIIDVSAAQLIDEFDANPIAFRQAYDFKNIRISTTISKVEGENHIYLEDGDGNISNDILCFMREDQPYEVASLVEGTPVTVVGLLSCYPWSNDVVPTSFDIVGARITNF